MSYKIYNVDIYVYTLQFTDTIISLVNKLQYYSVKFVIINLLILAYVQLFSKWKPQ